MSRRLRLLHGAHDWMVDASADGAITIGDERFHVSPAGEGRYRVVDADGVSTLVAVAGTAQALWASAEGRAHQLSADTAPTRTRAARQVPGGDLSAPMPATVAKVLVALGDRVSTGDPVVVLEAMKMELTIRAPRDGVVTAIVCTAGELVSPGRPLVELGA